MCVWGEGGDKILSPGKELNFPIGQIYRNTITNKCHAQIFSAVNKFVSDNSSDIPGKIWAVDMHQPFIINSRFLTLSPTTNFRLFQAERVYRRQFQI